MFSFCLCSPGSVATGVIVTLVVLLLVVAGIAVGVVVFITYRRKAARFDNAGAVNQKASGIDNPFSKCSLQECVYITCLCWYGFIWKGVRIPKVLPQFI